MDDWVNVERVKVGDICDKVLATTSNASLKSKGASSVPPAGKKIAPCWEWEESAMVVWLGAALPRNFRSESQPDVAAIHDLVNY